MIGVFDSGLGGLSVLREIHQISLDQPTLYYADQAHVPYGPRSESEIRAFAQTICDYLIGRGATVIVIACNTATAAAINWLRETYDGVEFVGMEPAIKPAAQLTKNGRIGVMATAGTFKSQRYATLMGRFAQGVELFENSCVGLVEQIESGDLESAKTKSMLESFIRPMLDKDIDTLILGCTHYPFVLPSIKTIVGDSVRVINPAPAVAKQTARLLPSSPKSDVSRFVIHEYVTTGSLPAFISMLNQLKTVGHRQLEVDKDTNKDIAGNLYLDFYQKVHNN